MTEQPKPSLVAAPREKAELALHDSLQRGDSIPDMVRVVAEALYPETPEPERIEAMGIGARVELWASQSVDDMPDHGASLRNPVRHEMRAAYAAERKWIGL